MPVTCTAASLASAAKCYEHLSWDIRKAIRILNYCAFLNGTTMTCTPQALAVLAACFKSSLSTNQLDAIETYLSCQIANSGGGSGSLVQVFKGNYGGVAPTDTPTASAAVAYDLDAPNREWYWTGSAWF